MPTLSEVHVVAKPDNRKTGPLPATYRPMTTCPADCPFLPAGAAGGCYGTGRLFNIADRWAGNIDVQFASAKVRVGRDPAVRYLRDRVVGDVLTPDGRLDRRYVAGIARVAAENDLTAFGYTHAWRVFTAADVRFLQRSGYVMNASAETHAGAVEAVERGLPVVLVDEMLPDGAMLGGRRIVTCPAETRQSVTCASCGLCARPGRSSIVRFHPHGTAVRKARAAIDLARRECP